MASLILPRDALISKMMRGDSSTLLWFKRINRLVTILYRSYIGPLLGLGYIFVLIETKGRKTGKKRFTPLEYHRLYENQITVVSSRGEKADWIKNMKAAHNIVRLYVGFKRYKAKAIYIDDIKEKHTMLKAYCIKYPYFSRLLFGIKVKDKSVFNTESFQALAAALTFVVFEPINPG